MFFFFVIKYLILHLTYSPSSLLCKVDILRQISKVLCLLALSITFIVAICGWNLHKDSYFLCLKPWFFEEKKYVSKDNNFSFLSHKEENFWFVKSSNFKMRKRSYKLSLEFEFSGKKICNIWAKIWAIMCNKVLRNCQERRTFKTIEQCIKRGFTVLRNPWKL